MQSLKFAAASFALALAAGAHGQTTMPAAPTITPAPACEKPGDPPTTNSSELGKAASEMKRANWIKNMKAYMECMKRFIDEQQTAAAPHMKAANAAVDEYNKAIKVFNDAVDVPPK